MSPAVVAAVRALPRELIGEASLAPIAEAASRLPAGAAFSMFGFEIPLGHDHAQADFLASFHRAAGGPALLASIGHPLAPLWDDSFDHVWLEYDVRRGDTAVPSVFFWPLVPGATERTLGALGCSIDGVRECLDALPPGAELFQAGAMLSRPASPARLCFRMLDDIPGFLAAAGFSTPLEPVVSLLASLRACAPVVLLDVDADRNPRLGFECYAPRWRPLLETLVERNACTPAERDALLRVRASDPANLGFPRLSAFHRRIHHVKVVLTPGHAIEAKAYIAVEHQWSAISGETPSSAAPLRPA